MKLIIAGSRDAHPSVEDVQAAVQAAMYFNIEEVVSGTARGADRAGEAWAAWAGIPVKRFPADWDRHGKVAGFKRNQQMAIYGTHLLAFHYNKSRGTADMIARMRGLGKPVFVVREDGTLSL